MILKSFVIGVLLYDAVLAQLPHFDVPPAQVALLQPRGFEVSIPGKFMAQNERRLNKQQFWITV